MSKKYKYEIIENPFHGGNHIGYSNTLIGAARRANREDHCTIYDSGMASHRCSCGGPCVRNADGSPLSYSNRERLNEIYYLMHLGKISKK